MAEWGKDFTEEDQRVATQRWSKAIAELQRLVAANADPAGAEAQTLMQQWKSLLQEFTHGDAGITKSLGNLYKGISQMPAGQAPYAMPYNQEEGKFLEKAMKAYNDLLWHFPLEFFDQLCHQHGNLFASTRCI